MTQIEFINENLDYIIRQQRVPAGACDSQHKQPYPQLIFLLDGKKLYVEFANRSGHAMSTSGKVVKVEVISWNRSVRQKGTAILILRI